jgi:hypothetical protein
METLLDLLPHFGLLAVLVSTATLILPLAMSVSRYIRRRAHTSVLIKMGDREITISKEGISPEEIQKLLKVLGAKTEAKPGSDGNESK